MDKACINDMNKRIFAWICFSIFLFSFYIREAVFKSGANINIIFIIIVIIYIYINKKSINPTMLIFLLFIMIYTFIIDYFINSNSITIIIGNICMIFIPMLLFTIRVEEKNFEEILITCLKIINFFIIIIFSIGIVDSFINFSIMKFVGEYIAPGLNDWISDNTSELILYRYTSFMGHPLFTKELFIYFFLLNSICEKKLLNKNLVTLISLIGVLLTGSKTGIVLILLCIIGLEIKDAKFKNIIISFILILTAYCIGFFDTVILRFQSESLTTGRSESIQYIKELNFIDYKFFSGYGERIHSIFADIVGEVYATASLEYPFRILLYKYGVVCLCMIIIYLIIYPTLCFLKYKQFYLLFAFIIKVIDINTYNGLIFKADNMILFVLFTYILLGICNNKNKAIKKSG